MEYSIRIKSPVTEGYVSKFLGIYIYIILDFSLTFLILNFLYLFKLCKIT